MIYEATPYLHFFANTHQNRLIFQRFNNFQYLRDTMNKPQAGENKCALEFLKVWKKESEDEGYHFSITRFGFALDGYGK